MSDSPSAPAPLPVYTLVLTGTSKIQNVLTVEGRGMKPYAFQWDAKLGRYAFRTSSEKELNDLLENAGLTEFHAFAIVLPDPTAFGAAPAAASVEPLKVPFKEVSEAKTLTRDQLVALLNGAGLYAGPKEATDKLARIVEGMFSGYAHAAAGIPLVIPPPAPTPAPEPSPAPAASLETVPDGQGGATTVVSDSTPAQDAAPAP